MKNTWAKLFLILAAAAALAALGACGLAGPSYSQISQDEAMRMMEEETDFIIVDVRRPDEFAEGHIAGAINVPNESIGDEQPAELPDLDQVLLVYCRSGNRSKEASQKLADLGYTQVYEFGGINTWEGEIVTEEQENMVKVTYDMQLMIGDTRVYVDWEQNASVDALAALTAGDWHEFQLSMYGDFEQVGPLGAELPSDDAETTTKPGDIVLYQGNQIVIFYGTNSWAYTRLGRVRGLSLEDLEALLGSGDTTISLKTEYSE